MTLRDDLERWLEYVDSDPEDMGGGKYLTPNEVRLILARDAKQAPTEDEREGVMRVVLGVDAWPAMGVHDGTPTLTEAGKVVDAILAAGYRKRPEVTVEDVKAWALKEFGVSNGTQVWIEFQGDPDRFATAVLALINGEGS